MINTEIQNNKDHIVGQLTTYLAGGLTLAGGVMTVMTAGAALPVLVAVSLWIY